MSKEYYKGTWNIVSVLKDNIVITESGVVNFLLDGEFLSKSDNEDIDIQKWEFINSSTLLVNNADSLIVKSLGLKTKSLYYVLGKQLSTLQGLNKRSTNKTYEITYR